MMKRLGEEENRRYLLRNHEEKQENQESTEPKKLKTRSKEIA